MSRKLVVIGKSGFVDGERFEVPFGTTVTIGRSRSADISYRDLPRCREMSKEEQDSNDALLTISGKHFEIKADNENSVTIRDTSSNGTFLNDRRVDERELNDVMNEEYEISFGMDERVVLSVEEDDTGDVGTEDEELAESPDVETPEEK